MNWTVAILVVMILLILGIQIVFSQTKVLHNGDYAFPSKKVRKFVLIMILTEIPMGVGVWLWPTDWWMLILPFWFLIYMFIAAIWQDKLTALEPPPPLHITYSREETIDIVLQACTGVISGNLKTVNDVQTWFDKYY